MSPRWSSSPRMSLITAKSLPSRIRPMAMPATGRFSGTPASMRASEPPQTVAIDEEPLVSVMSDRTRIVYGNSSIVGSIGCSARHASLPWPTSRRARSAEASDFADRIRREVIVQHEARVGEALQPVDHLLRLPWCRAWWCTIAWVSPRVNRAEPCVRGRKPTIASIGRTVLVSRPSMRRPSLRIAPRTMSASRPLTAFDGDQLLLRLGVGEGGLRPCRGRR